MVLVLAVFMVSSSRFQDGLCQLSLLPVALDLFENERLENFYARGILTIIHPQTTTVDLGIVMNVTTGRRIHELR